MICDNIIGKVISQSHSPEQIFEAVYTSSDPVVTDHRIYGMVVVPGSLHLARLHYVMANIYNQPNFEITKIAFTLPLIIKENQSKKVQLIINNLGAQNYAFKFISNSDGNWATHAEGLLSAALKPAAVNNYLPLLGEIKQHCTARLAMSRFDNYFISNELTYGPAYKWLDEIYTYNRESLSFMRNNSTPLESHWGALQAGQIDCSFQAFAAVMLDTVEKATEKEAWILGAINNLKFYALPQADLVCHNVLLDFQAISVDSKRAIGNITYYDQQGNLIAEFSGILVAKASQAKILKFLQGQG